MFEDLVIDRNPDHTDYNEKYSKQCRYCGSKNIEKSNKMLSTVVPVNSRIFYTYKTFIRCLTCNRTWHVTHTEYRGF